MRVTDQILESEITPYVTTGVPTVQTDSSIDDTIDKMASSEFGIVFLVNSTDGKLLGTITYEDLTKLKDNRARNASELATRKVVAIRKNAQLWQLLKIINGENSLCEQLDSLPVVDADSKPVGIVQRAKLISKLTKMQENGRI
jgi:predicted transcriptional regulator